jgi:hypothetical protein
VHDLLSLASAINRNTFILFSGANYDRIAIAAIAAVRDGDQE